MDVVMGFMAEAAIYLVAYLVDWLKWWRFIVSILVAGVASLVCHQFNGGSNMVALAFAIAIAAFGIIAGFIWERRAQRQ
jgi:hypothetical protein